jgi:hypothetical protein
MAFYIKDKKYYLHLSIITFVMAILSSLILPFSFLEYYKEDLTMNGYLKHAYADIEEINSGKKEKPFILKSHALQLRYFHWHKLYDGIDNSLNFVFPNLTKYRLFLNKQEKCTLHNEFLEIYSQFGIILLIVYYYVLILIIGNIFSYSRFIALSIMFLIFIGGIIQFNSLNPYMAILITTTIGLYSIQSENSTYRKENK